MNPVSPQSNSYDYNVNTSFPQNSNVHIHIHNTPGGAPLDGKPRLILEKSGKVPNPPGFLGKMGKKALSAAKKIRMSHIMAFTMCGLMCFARLGSATGNSGSAQSASRKAQQEWFYNQGAQHVRDSIVIAELQKQNHALQDSVKLLKKLPK